MRPQPIMNYKQRIEEYRKERKEFYFRELPLFYILCLLINMGLFYLMERINGSTTAPHDIDWRICALLFSFIAIAPVIAFMKPTKPEYNDVVYDQALRKAAGMDDTVAE